MEDQIKCPICNGRGKLKITSKFIKPNLEKIKIAKALRKAGYSLREIAKLMNINHPQSIQHLLDQ